jgi:hypothetical protein
VLNDFLSIHRDRNALDAAQHEIRFEIGGPDKKLRDVGAADVRQVLEATVRGFLHGYQKIEKDLPEPVRTRSILLKLARDVVDEMTRILPLLAIEDRGEWGVKDNHFIDSEDILELVQNLRKRARTILDEEATEPVPPQSKTEAG